ncbi:MAG: hypothetical protein HRT99_02925 [Mycoplasmatales bacterium]|nr:hypothetical protein [Mycoplasmatales bacterium]
MNKLTGPAESTSFQSMGGVDYIIGTLFILIGLVIYVLFQKKAKIRAEKYKQEQLVEYNKNRGTNVSDYKKTRLYLPFWEKVKFVTPIMLTITFILIGSLWIIWAATGVPLTTL